MKKIYFIYYIIAMVCLLLFAIVTPFCYKQAPFVFATLALVLVINSLLSRNLLKKHNISRPKYFDLSIFLLYFVFLICKMVYSEFI